MPNNRVSTPKKKTPKSRGAWPDWIESEEGKRCANLATLKAAPYPHDFLENRLWAAFVASAAAGRKEEK